MSRSTFARLAAVTALVAGGLVAAPPAHAAALAVDVSCEALGRYRVLCERTVSGGTAPFTTKWYYNGNYFPAYDNKAYTSWSCSMTLPNSYQAVVTDATGASATDTSGVGCRSGLP